MELWIRTQDKEKLVAVYELELDSYSANKKDYWTINNYGCILGTYKTKERALEILDEIQKKLTIKRTEEFSGIEYILANDLAPVIYQMPKE